MSLRTYLRLWLMVCVLATPTMSVAAETPDTTAVKGCDNLPASASIEVSSWSDTAKICREMLKVLEGVTIHDLQTLEKGVYVLSFSDYEKGQYAQIASEFVDIIRLGGSTTKRPAGD